MEKTEKIKIINLTPHELNLYEGDKLFCSIPSQGVVRVNEQKRPITKNGKPLVICGLPVVEKTFGTTNGLPAEQEGIFYFVSIVVQQANPGRRDLITSSKLIRDEKGRPIGCKEFSQVEAP